MESTAHVTSTSEDIIPYQFEPRKNDNDIDDEWTDCSEESNEEEPDVEKTKRNKVDAEEWCKCGNCQQKEAEVECICCWELKETKTMSDKNNISMLEIYFSEHSAVLANILTLEKSILLYLKIEHVKGIFFPQNCIL